MIVVFWLAEGEHAPRACFRSFGQEDLTPALQFAQQLRAERAAGAPLSHVCIQSELPHSVGRAGVSDPDPGYAHYKRRLDPSVPLGRPRPPAVGEATEPPPPPVEPLPPQPQPPTGPMPMPEPMRRR